MWNLFSSTIQELLADNEIDEEGEVGEKQKGQQSKSSHIKRRKQDDDEEEKWRGNPSPYRDDAIQHSTVYSSPHIEKNGWNGTNGCPATSSTLLCPPSSHHHEHPPFLGSQLEKQMSSHSTPGSRRNCTEEEGAGVAVGAARLSSSSYLMPPPTENPPSMGGRGATSRNTMFSSTPIASAGGASPLPPPSSQRISTWSQEDGNRSPPTSNPQQRIRNEIRGKVRALPLHEKEEEKEETGKEKKTEEKKPQTTAGQLSNKERKQKEGETNGKNKNSNPLQNSQSCSRNNNHNNVVSSLQTGTARETKEDERGGGGGHNPSPPPPLFSSSSSSVPTATSSFITPQDNPGGPVEKHLTPCPPSFTSSFSPVQAIIVGANEEGGGAGFDDDEWRRGNEREGRKKKECEKGTSNTPSDTTTVLSPPPPPLHSATIPASILDENKGKEKSVDIKVEHLQEEEEEEVGEEKQGKEERVDAGGGEATVMMAEKSLSVHKVEEEEEDRQQQPRAIQKEPVSAILMESFVKEEIQHETVEKEEERKAEAPLLVEGKLIGHKIPEVEEVKEEKEGVDRSRRSKLGKVGVVEEQEDNEKIALTTPRVMMATTTTTPTVDIPRQEKVLPSPPTPTSPTLNIVQDEQNALHPLKEDVVLSSPPENVTKTKKEDWMGIEKENELIVEIPPPPPPQPQQPIRLPEMEMTAWRREAENLRAIMDSPANRDEQGGGAMNRTRQTGDSVVGSSSSSSLFEKERLNSHHHKPRRAEDPPTPPQMVEYKKKLEATELLVAELKKEIFEREDQMERVLQRERKLQVSLQDAESKVETLRISLQEEEEENPEMKRKRQEEKWEQQQLSSSSSRLLHQQQKLEQRVQECEYQLHTAHRLLRDAMNICRIPFSASVAPPSLLDLHQILLPLPSSSSSTTAGTGAAATPLLWMAETGVVEGVKKEWKNQAFRHPEKYKNSTDRHPPVVVERDWWGNPPHQQDGGIKGTQQQPGPGQGHDLKNTHTKHKKSSPKSEKDHRSSGGGTSLSRLFSLEDTGEEDEEEEEENEEENEEEQNEKEEKISLVHLASHVHHALIHVVERAREGLRLEQEWKMAYQQAKEVQQILELQVEEGWQAVGFLQEDISVKEEALQEAEQQIREEQERCDALLRQLADAAHPVDSLVLLPSSPFIPSRQEGARVDGKGVQGREAGGGGGDGGGAESGCVGGREERGGEGGAPGTCTASMPPSAADGGGGGSVGKRADWNAVQTLLQQREEELHVAQQRALHLQEALDRFHAHREKELASFTEDLQKEVAVLQEQVERCTKREREQEEEIKGLKTQQERERREHQVTLQGMHQKLEVLRRQVTALAPQHSFVNPEDNSHGLLLHSSFPSPSSSSSSQDPVDKSLLAHVFVSFLHAFFEHRKEAPEMLKVLSGLLDWDEEMQIQVGLLPGPGNPQPPSAAAGKRRNGSFSFPSTYTSSSGMEHSTSLTNKVSERGKMLLSGFRQRLSVGRYASTTPHHNHHAQNAVQGSGGGGEANANTTMRVSHTPGNAPTPPLLPPPSSPHYRPPLTLQFASTSSDKDSSPSSSSSFAPPDRRQGSLASMWVQFLLESTQDHKDNGNGEEYASSTSGQYAEIDEKWMNTAVRMPEKKEDGEAKLYRITDTQNSHNPTAMVMGNGVIPIRAPPPPSAAAAAAGGGGSGDSVEEERWNPQAGIRRMEGGKPVRQEEEGESHSTSRNGGSAETSASGKTTNSGDPTATLMRMTPHSPSFPPDGHYGPSLRDESPLPRPPE